MAGYQPKKIEGFTYSFKKDKSGNYIAELSMHGEKYAICSIPSYESDIEAGQRFVYAVANAYIKYVGAYKR